MANIDQDSSRARISTTSYDTALCVIPPISQCGHIDQLRELYDKAYERWPPHINLVYPFVSPENLPRAQQQIQDYVMEQLDPSEPIEVAVGEAGCFKQKNKYTIFLGESKPSSPSRLADLRTLVLQALGQGEARSTLHLTVGQSQDSTMFAREYLLAKARLLPSLKFRAQSLAILIRERTGDADSTGHMRLYGLINIGPQDEACGAHPTEFWLRSSAGLPLTNQEEEDEDESIPDYDREVRFGSTFCFDQAQDKWTICTVGEQQNIKAETLHISSYNVLIDTEYPPTHDRDPLLVNTILGDTATADVLVLQEVSDDFLSYILEDVEIRRKYPFISHAPPSQPDIGPLPSLRNIVILSNHFFSWKSVPFHRKHKGAVVAYFKGIAKPSSSGSGDLVVAGVHLTSGLTDGSVAAKKSQMKNLTGYLDHYHARESWIVTGDFNLVTSSYTIDTALSNRSISNETVTVLSSIESTINDAGLIDAWSVAQIESTDETTTGKSEELFEGEEGATFDPQNNRLAAGSSTTSHDRAQRYDRILVRPHNALRISRFNQFGLPEETDGMQVVASDHYGVRATLQVLDDAPGNAGNDMNPTENLIVEHKRAVTTLSESSDIDSALAAHSMLPNEEQKKQRQGAFETLEQVVLGSSDDTNSNIPMVMVPVGSYALDVWSSGSDIDCLCIGTISSKTFFKLARRRLVKAESQGVRILRRVDANTGTMLELSVNGIYMDLQYCPAAKIVERYVIVVRFSLGKLTVLQMVRTPQYPSDGPHL
jgi:endonuclease/exonuclease/phosphatase family metal-dependent hydrolase